RAGRTHTEDLVFVNASVEGLLIVPRHGLVEATDHVHGFHAPRSANPWGAFRDRLDDVLDQLAINLVANAQAGNWDGAQPKNVILDVAGRVTQYDFDPVDRLVIRRSDYSHGITPDRSLPLVLGTLIFRCPPYQRLTEVEVVELLRESLRHRHR